MTQGVTETIDEGAPAPAGDRRSGEPRDLRARTLVGRPTPCVGRDRELSFLEGLFRESAEEKAARVALVMAPPGAGKSRLQRELVLRIAAHEPAPLVLFAAGSAIGNRGALGMLGEALRRAAGLFDLEQRADMSTESLQLARWLGRRLDTGQAASTVALLLDVAGVGVPDPFRALGGDAARGATLRAWMQWLAAELDVRPVVVVLDDLHWSDQPSVELLDGSLRAFAKKPLTVLAFARPEVKRTFPELWAEREPQELRLGPLTRAAGASLVRTVLRDADDATVTSLVERGGGNAFLLEELVRAHLAGGARTEPDTVVALLKARAAALAPELARVLSAASVFGDSFWQEGVAALVGVEAGSPRLATWLSMLAEQELIQRKSETSIARLQELSFRHDIVREVAYDLLAEDERRDAHRRAGEWLESVAVRDAAVLAEHYDRAGESTRAIHWACLDAERAIHAMDVSASTRAERGVALGASGVTLGRLLTARASTLDWRSDPGALAVVDAAMALVPRASEHWYRCALLRLTSLAKAASEAPFVAAAMALASTTPAASDKAAEVEYVASVGEAIFVSARNEMPAAITALVAALGPYLLRASEMAPRAGAYLESVMAMGSALGRMPEAALRGAQRAVEHQRAAGELTHVAELMVAQRLWFVGELDDAARIIDRVLSEAERMGCTRVLRLARIARASAAACFSQYDEAYKRAIAVRNGGGAAMEPAVHTTLDLLVAQCAFRTRRIVEGKEAVTAALARTPRGAPMRARLEMVRAEGLLADGRTEEAVALVETTLPLVQPSPFHQEDCEHALLHANALLEVGEAKRARDVIAVAVSELRARAKAIGDTRLRESFLSRVTAHRELLALAIARGL